MRSSRLFQLRSARSKRWAVVLMLALVLYPIAPRYGEITVHAQVQAAPVGQGFVLTAEDLRFIYRQILVAQRHVVTRTFANPCGTLLGPGPNQVTDPQMPAGLRTVDGTCNNLVQSPPTPNPRNEPDQHLFGSADRTFPRLTTPVYRDADPPPGGGAPTSYKQKLAGNVVYDSQPRMISNLIVDQSDTNPAAVQAATHPCGSGGFVCSDPASLDDVRDADSGALFIPNITPDFGLSAPFNLMFAFFGQFFDHGLDLVTKGGGTVIMTLRDDDPLVAGPDKTFGTPDDIPAQFRFMPMTRGQNQPGPDGQLGTADDIQEGMNETTPWVDQNQTYTSHPSHQVFLREYETSTGRPLPNGKVLDGGFCAQRNSGLAGDEICDIGNWAEVKAQAAQKLGLLLQDQDVLNVPTIATDPYGHFIPGPARGLPQYVTGSGLVEGNVAAPVAVPDDAVLTGHAFLNDIAHNAVPVDGNGNVLPADDDGTICDFRQGCQQAGTYDDELLNAHFITGDGRGNENIGLTMVHNLFHAEHNRLRFYIDNQINTNPEVTAQERADWHAIDPGGSGWGYGERLFQAARFVTEMEYQHLVFEEFARTIQPLINPFLGGLTNIDPAISAEFAHTVYRLGHSMLPERLDRINSDAAGSDNEIRLLDAFLNPPAYNNGGPAGPLTADKAAGSLIRGLTRQVGNELDEFVTSSVRNTLVGLPLDLPAINIARGRSEGIPPLNVARAQFFALTQDAAVQPYANWSEFRFGLRHDESFANFLAAYATEPTIVAAPTLPAKRLAAQTLVNNNDPFLFTSATTSGLNNVDFWIGGLAEKPAVFGGLLGSTFNYVFELQLEHLQDGDRFYYLQRLDGTNFVQQLEGNSFAELARRNTDVGATMDIIFKTADFVFETSKLPATGTTDLGGGMVVMTQADGTKVFFDPLHSGKNITVNGTAGNDRWKSDVGDDTMYGNGGNDRLDGGEGNDTLLGGDGDDILLGGNGDDVLKGGPGNDALNSGPGFGGDLELGGDGNDFMVGGNDGVEYFAGPGDDIIVDGSMRAELIQAGEGDDWIDDGEGHDGGMFGDEANNFDLLAGLNVTGGDDVEGGGPGQDNHFGFGGNDVYLMSEGSNKFFGDYGFDWITLRGWNAPEFIELSLLANPALPVNFNDLRNRYRFVDGASGWTLNDHIAGSNSVLCTPPGEVAECLIVGMELVAGTPPTHQLIPNIPGAFNIRGGSGAAKIGGLTELMAAFGPAGDLNAPAIPLVKDVGFMGGDILLGGPGSDLLEGKQGDDLIDGDAWLNVQLRAVYNDGHVRFVDSPRDLVADVFADPQLLNPGNISIVRSIVDATLPNAQSQTIPAPDCGAASPLNCDVAVFAFPRADYTITRNTTTGIVTVQHNPARAADIPLSTGTDTLRNIERLRFSDGVEVNVAAGLNSAATGSVTISPATPSEDGLLAALTSGISDTDGFDLASVVIDWEMETTPGVFTLITSGNVFTPSDPQVGHALRAVARFTDFLGNAEAVRSAATPPVLNVNDPPVGQPSLNVQSPTEAQAITANPAGITDADGLGTFRFQWRMSAAGGGAPFTNIGGATAASFTPTQAQVNRQLRVAVSYTDAHGTNETVVSIPTTDVVGDLFVGGGGIDNVSGTTGRDNLSGAGGNDVLSGGAGDDILNGNAGDDTLSGQGGNDTITGGNGNDTITGGAGNDLILVGPNDGTDDVTGGADVDTIQATANGTVIGLSNLAGVEFITGSTFTNVSILMSGGAANDTFNLAAANVTLTNISSVTINGNGGADTITGSPQADVIDGGAGTDTINGGGGDDIITGGAGADTMNGGAGANTFKFAAAFAGNTAATGDTINGFDANPTGGQDKIDLTALGITAATFAQRVVLTTSGTNTVVTVRTPTATPGVFVTEGVITIVGVTPGAGNNQITIADFIVLP